MVTRQADRTAPCSAHLLIWRRVGRQALSGCIYWVCRPPFFALPVYGKRPSTRTAVFHWNALHWTRFVRQRTCGTTSSGWGFRLRFETPVRTPFALGRLAHFGSSPQTRGRHAGGGRGACLPPPCLPFGARPALQRLVFLPCCCYAFRIDETGRSLSAGRGGTRLQARPLPGTGAQGGRG